MSKHGKKQIFDMATMTYREEDLTPEEIAQCERDEKEHLEQMAVYAKIKYLDDRKKDPRWPTLEEMVWAMWQSIAYGDGYNALLIKKRIEDIEAKYPGP